MLFFHTVEIDVEFNRTNPLYVGHFFNLKGMRWRNRVKRQQMIVSVALAWYRLVKNQLSCPGMLTEELMLTGLTKEVKEARHIIECFFKIEKLGFNLGDGTNHSPTVVTPRKHGQRMVDCIAKISERVVFRPGLPPPNKSLVQSNVKVRVDRAAFVRIRLKKEDREDLLPAVNWLYDQVGEVTFYYRPAGKLQARDTSIWPVKCIEQWPGWLRAELFGVTVDIENAFCQFLLEHLEKIHSANPNLLKLKYPDLLRAAYDKKAFREELCIDILRKPVNDDNISIVKKLIMALANGSNATANLMVTDGRVPEAVALVKQASPDLLPTQQLLAGDRLQRIAQQFRSAKRELCISLLGEKPTRDNQKKIFRMYFEWEKIARYKIWDAIGRTGLHLHDGLDGVITDLSEQELVELVKEKTNIRVSADMPSEESHEEQRV